MRPAAEEIFDPFRQVGRRLDRPREGSGLVLPAAHDEAPEPAETS